LKKKNVAISIFAVHREKIKKNLGFIGVIDAEIVKAFVAMM
jgi:hypothetical protein